jgi:hypothetical protein
MPTRYNYVAQRYKQGEAPLELYTFCASAKDIRGWGGVPAKTEQFHGGFQRALSPRYKKIAKFFEDEMSSPTSIVVAFREGVLNDTDLGFPDAWPKTLTTKPQFAALSFDCEEFSEDTDLEVLIKRVSEILKPRLDASAAAGADTAVEAEETEENGEEEEANESDNSVDASESDEDSGLDVGHSKLKAFYEFINNRDNRTSWLNDQNEKYETIKAKATRNAKENEFIQFTPEQRLKSALTSLLRPAMIVDGQHRVSGAYESPNDIQYAVCAIRDANWVEQVFQFVVLNKLAKPISSDFLTALLNTSLTNKELDDIVGRLETVGIKDDDRVLMKYLNFDVRSPFYQMVAEAGEVVGVDNKGKLSARGMLRLAKRWIAISRNKKELQMFYPLLGVENSSAAKKKWIPNNENRDVPMSLFYAFWESLKELYEPEGVWEKAEKFHLLYIVTMHVLQDLFIETKAKADVRYNSVDEMKADVRRFFEDVKAPFFRDWKATGLQSGEGPTNIRDAVEQLRAGTRLLKLMENSPLYR